MPKKKEKHALPERAPKKSGKRGIGPIDPVSDFDKPVTRAPEPKGSSLQADVPPAPSIANGRFKIFYDRPFITKIRDRILIALQITVPLEDEHAELLPKIVADAQHDVLKRGRKKIICNGIPAQHVSFFLTSDRKEELLTVPACKMINTNIAIVERKGEGSARKVTRLSFRLQAERSQPLATFAELNLANDFWVEMKESQESLWDEDEN